MTRSSSSKLEDFDPEIAFRARLRTQAEQSTEKICQRIINMAEGNQNLPGNQFHQQENPVFQPMTMADYARPSLNGAESSIVRPTIAANNFEIKPNMIQMVQHNV